MRLRRLVSQNRHQRSVTAVEMERFEQTHSAVLIHDGFDGLNHELENTRCRLCDKRRNADYGGGEIYFDGKLIRKDGIFLPKPLQALNPVRLLG